MDFFLTYRGPLGSNKGPKEKHELRKHFHKQLESLFRNHKALKEMTSWKDPPAKDSIDCLVPLGGFKFAPLVSSKLHCVAELDITMLWSELPGNILKKGDVDNKLKTLLDALSCPPHENQLQKMLPDADETPFYCLLEDDTLLQDVHIRTHTLLNRNSDEEVSLQIQVKVKPTCPIWGNLGFL